MPYKQLIESNFSDSKIINKITKASFEARQGSLLKIIEELQQENLKLFDFSDIDQKVKDINSFVTLLQNRFQHLVILGTGGSTLCGQCLVGLQDNQKKNNLTFVDNIDPITLKSIAEDIDLEKTAILTISKSGGTLEVLAQLIFFLNLYKEKLGEESLSTYFFAISDVPNSGKNILREIAQQFSIKVLEHENVGGRFSIFTNVGLIPAAFTGLDIGKILNGARSIVDDIFCGSKNISEPAKGAIFSFLYEANGYNSTVMMPYIDRMRKFNLWYSQIWAESLGKNGYGMTPIRALGSLDQHSQLQQFLDGKEDKIFNVIITKNHHNEFAKLDTSILNNNSLEFLNNKDFTKLINTSAESTIASLQKNERPVRVFELEQLDEFAMGAICMHFILETVLVAKMVGFNPFDQPAVEEGKQMTLKILKAS